MKKSHIRSFSWAVLIAISLASYIYLKQIPIEEYQQYAIEENSTIDENNTDETKILMPDIAFVKKIIDLTKLIFHNG